MTLKSFQWLLLLVQILLVVGKIRAKVPAVIVFGDSTVDAGNNNQISTILKSNFRPYGKDFFGGVPTGRFSNGRLPTDFISESFGCKPTIPAYLDPQYSIKDFATGVCFASAGTGYDNATSDVLSVIPLWKELEYYKDYQGKLSNYLGDAQAKVILSEALYLISIGTNDFLENYFVFPNRSSVFTVGEYEDFLLGIAVKFMKDIYGLGARKISITGLPPMGCVPLVRTISRPSANCLEKYNDVAKDFNKKLDNLIVKMNKELNGVKVVTANTYGIVLDMIQNPLKYGFEKVSTACCATGLIEMSYLCNQLNPLTCKDASKYVFWDSFHPTEKTNFIIADYVMKTSLAQFL
ncbi:hypothetical protein IFM89_024765 [Coptis chinensis]|uniref:GDSL esterase/lipase n=1 Tax=Coptis chinensis TaxID=261450 RepID=A0A835LF25_9MAGN|nr:hypothetical protein IFM89_024765 [Coptis chinensis]